MLIIDFCRCRRSQQANYGETRQRRRPPIFLSTASRISMTPRGVLTYMHSPRLRPFWISLVGPESHPLASRSRCSSFAVTGRVGLEMTWRLFMTGSLLLYLRPTHRRWRATVEVLSGSGSYVLSVDGSGGTAPPLVTKERNPVRCRDRSRFRFDVFQGALVRPRRALEAFCKCEHTFARFLSVILSVEFVSLRLDRYFLNRYEFS